MNDKIKKIASEKAAELGLSLWDVRLEKEGPDRHLVFYVDKADGMTSDDCEAFSKLVDPLLEEIGAFENADYLDVSSPGLGRKLMTEEHFAAYIGEEVTIKLYKAIDGEKEFVGILQSYDEEAVTIDGTEYEKAQYSYIKLNDDLNLF